MRMGDYSKDWMNGNKWKVCRSDVRQETGAEQAVPPLGGPALPSESQIKRARLVRTIESEIVPRLVLTRRKNHSQDAPTATESQSLDCSDVSELVRLLMRHDVSVGSAYVEAVRQRGASLEAVCLELLAPAARQFGMLWEHDECDFMQVTVGLCRLHQLLRELSPEFGATEIDRKVNRRILLAPCPGEQHTFGLSLVAQFLRRADWDVWHEFPGSGAEIVEVVRQNWFAVIGLSVGTQARLDALALTIGLIRRESRNRGIGVLVGGPILVERPELARLVGADATAADGPQAVLRAEHICNGMRAAINT
jgi:MerR family transcriptional regulator, light-induced transcriptional regulator